MTTQVYFVRFTPYRAMLRVADKKAKSNNVSLLTSAMALLGQTPILRQVPCTILAVPIKGNRTKQIPLIHGKATPTLVIQSR